MNKVKENPTSKVKTEFDEEKTPDQLGKLTMEDLVREQGSALIPYEQGQIIKASVIHSSSGRIWLDLNGFAQGVVPEQELSVLSENLHAGDTVQAYILNVEDLRGNMILSLRRADQERLSDDLKKKYREGAVVDVKIQDANKGGLLIEIGDYQGFLPVSQLASKHYPRVDGGDPNKIYVKLKDLIGKSLKAKIINFDANTGKLIFSEKAAGDEEQEIKLSKIKEGDVVEGTITGIVDFGIFVKIGDKNDEIEGLVHISEIAWGRVNNLDSMFKVGEKVKVLIVSTEDSRVSLSMKRLQKDPWREASKKYKINDTVKGEVTKITDYGLFVRIHSEIDGLVHLSEINSGNLDDLLEKYEIGKNYSFRIISFDPDAHRLGLSLKLSNQEEKAKDKTEKPATKKGKLSEEIKVEKKVEVKDEIKEEIKPKAENLKEKVKKSSL